jgi:hypothetical protein
VLSFSDEQLAAIRRAAEPLQPVDRTAFLEPIAAFFRGRQEIGSGDLHRAIADLQREYAPAN